jgi:hypothetical protein
MVRFGHPENRILLRMAQKYKRHNNNYDERKDVVVREATEQPTHFGRSVASKTGKHRKSMPRRAA